MVRGILISSAIGIVGILLLLAFFDHNFSRSYHHALTKTTDLSKENIEGLFLHDDSKSEQIIEKYGRKTEQSRDVTGYDYYEFREGIEIATNKFGEITRFIVTDSNLETIRGIKIGDKKEEIIKAYGENDYFRTEQGLHIIGYVDKMSNTSIEFWLVDDKLYFYRLDIQSMQ